MFAISVIVVLGTLRVKDIGYRHVKSVNAKITNMNTVFYTLPL